MSRVVLFLFVALLTNGCAKKTEEAPAPAPEPAPKSEAAPAPTPATPVGDHVGDASGNWQYTTSNRKVDGMCPAGADSSGTLEIKQTDSTFTLTYTSGQTCKPQSMCTYQGTVNGSRYDGKNSDKVDDEGGQVVNTIILVTSSPTAGAGNGTSTYSHPSGMTCKWTYDITLTK